MSRPSSNPCDKHLIYGAWKGDMAAACHALAHGGSVNARDGEGKTPLMWAALKGHTEIFRLLLARGADPFTQDHMGYTALEAAAKGGHKEMVDLLLERGEAPEAALIWAAEGGQTALFEALLAEGYPIPPLCMHQAVSSGNLAAVQAALDRGEPASGGALIDAAHRGHTQIVALLLAHGADPNFTDRDGMDAMWWARNQEIKDLLKQAGYREFNSQ